MLRAVWTIAMKDLRVMLRQRADAFFIFVFPVLYAAFFTMIGSGGGGGGIDRIKLVVVDEDRSAASAAFVAQLEKSSALTVEPDSRAAAMNAVRTGKRVAYLLIEDGFGDSQDFLFAGETPQVTLGIDPSHQAEAGLLQGLLNQAGARLMQDRFRNPDQLRRQVAASKNALALPGSGLPADQKSALSEFLDSLDKLSRSNNGNFPSTGGGINDNAADNAGDNSASSSSSGGGGMMQPLIIKLTDVSDDGSGHQNPATITLPQGMVWGLLACAAAFGTSLVSERTRGTLVRLRTSPITPAHILAGKGLACFITLVAVSTLLLVVGRLMFGVVPQSIPLLAMAIISSGVCVVGLMMLIAVLGKTEAGVNGMGWAILLVMAMFGGAMVPSMFMPGWMQSLSFGSPVRWAILSVEGALWRNYSLAEMLKPCAVLVSIGVVTFAAGASLFRWHAD